MKDKIYLQRVLKHTNIDMLKYGKSKNDYISAKKFPAQIEDLINTEITLKYRDYIDYVDPITIEKAAIRTVDGEVVSSRPEDDIQKPHFVPLTPEELAEYPYYKERTFRVLRADSEYPWIFIAISPDYMELIDGSTQIYTTDEEGNEVRYNIDDFMTVVDGKVCIIYDPDAHPLYTKIISIYALQQFDYIGSYCETRYEDGVLNSNVIRADSTEPCKSVLIEWTDEVDDEGNMHHSIPRYILGDEVNAEFLSKMDNMTGDVYDFGELEEPETESASGDYDFGDLEEGKAIDSVAKGDYDFIILAYTYDKASVVTNLDAANYRKSLIEGQ